MSPETERRRPGERTDVEVTEEVSAMVARTGDMDEAVAELVAGQEAGAWPIFSAGFSAGHRCGLDVGYRQGLAVLDEAGALLADPNEGMTPRQAIDAAAARRRQTEYARKPETAEQIAARARYQWSRLEREIPPEPPGPWGPAWMYPAEQQGRGAG